MSSFLPASSYKYLTNNPPKQDGIFKIEEIEKFPKFMLVDMNSFFASVEQQANPFFRGKPLGVVASMHKTSCLIAASKEAKKMGIKTGTLIWKAQQICPKIILVESEPAKYRQVNKAVNKILSDYCDRVEPYSIDESFLDFRFSDHNILTAGMQIKRRILDEVGVALTCSVGIGPNKFISKLASDLNKPDGLTVLWRNQLPEVYKNLKLTDLWGVSYGWQRRLAGLGLFTPMDVWRYPLANLAAAFGKPGYYLWQRIQGLEDDFGSGVGVEDRPKSFGHSWVLNFRTKNKERLAVAVMRLAEKAARRMRLEQLQARGVYLYMVTAGGQRFHQSKKLQRYVNTGLELYEEALVMWRDWKFDSDVSQIAVGFFALSEHHQQLTLFGGNGMANKQLNDCVDLINNKHGEFTVRSGLLAGTDDYAPEAIAFGL